jgi:signal transduction histidine kinase
LQNLKVLSDSGNEEKSTTETLPHSERDERRRWVLGKNTSIASLGYLLPWTAYLIVRIFDLATYSFRDLAICAMWILVSHFTFHALIRRRSFLTNGFVNRITFCQLANWTAIYGYCISFLNEIRLSALLVAFIGIIFVLPNAGFLASLLLSCSVAAIYIAISYFQIYYGHQNGVFPLELMYVCFFLFAALYVAFAAGKFKSQREEIVLSKRKTEAASRAKSDFLANMSHELRTPLNHIIGFAELVADKQCGDLNEVQEEYLNDVLESSRHLLSLINDILDLSKVEAGKLELELADIQPRVILESSLNMLKEKALRHHIRLSTNLAGIPEVIRADERKVKQILYNLLSNAVKFTPDGGSVTLAARSLAFIDGQWRTPEGKAVSLSLNGGTPFPGEKDLLEISIQDTGIGIRSGDLQRIFDSFVQVESSASRRFQGTGLGLSLTRRLVELHGGKIWAESAGEGRGSRFVSLMPV